MSGQSSDSLHVACWYFHYLPFLFICWLVRVFTGAEKGERTQLGLLTKRMSTAANPTGDANAHQLLHPQTLIKRLGDTLGSRPCTQTQHMHTRIRWLGKFARATRTRSRPFPLPCLNSMSSWANWQLATSRRSLT